MEAARLWEILGRSALRGGLGVVGVVAGSLVLRVVGVGWKAAFVVMVVVVTATAIKASIGKLAIGMLILTACATLVLVGRQPSHDLDWLDEVSKLPSVAFEGSRIIVSDLRDFHWHSETAFDPTWIQRDFDLDRLTGLDLLVEPFGESKLAAHVMLRFRFSEGEPLVVSVEARREKGETYGLLDGAIRQFELIYVLASEEDILELRAVHRGSRLYAFPLRVDDEFRRSLLLSLAESANALHNRPRFYATIRDNCTTTLLRHANRLIEKPIPLHREILFPARSGELLHRLGLMDTTLAYEEALLDFRIDEELRTQAARRDAAGPA